MNIHRRHEHTHMQKVVIVRWSSMHLFSNSHQSHGVIKDGAISILLSQRKQGRRRERSSIARRSCLPGGINNFTAPATVGLNDDATESTTLGQSKCLCISKHIEHTQAALEHAAHACKAHSGTCATVALDSDATECATFR